MAALLVLGGKIASASVILPITGGSGVPDGSGAGFPADETQPYEVQQAVVTSPVEYTYVPIGGGDIYDLRFFVTTYIYKDYSTNPAGTVDFIYQLHNTSDNNETTVIGDSIDRLTLQSFAGYGVTADYIYGTGSSPVGGDGGLDAPPLEIDRSAAPGSVVGFDFSDSNTQTPLIPDTYSDFLVVRTNATSWYNGTASVIGGLGLSATVQVPFGSAVSVPEPMSLSLIALAGTALLGRRRRNVR